MNMDESSHFDQNQKNSIKDLFSQGVKHKMKVNFVRSLSTSTKTRHHSVTSRNDLENENGDNEEEDDIFEEKGE